MNYQCHEGIVLTKMMGKWILIPTRKASIDCPGIIELSLPSAMIWALVSKKRPMADIYKIHKIFFKKEPEESKESTDLFLKELCDKGYLKVVNEDS